MGITSSSVLGGNWDEAPVHGYNGPLILHFTFFLPLFSFFLLPFLSLRKYCFFLIYVLIVLFAEKHSGNMHISTCTISSLKYLLLKNIPSEGVLLMLMKITFFYDFSQLIFLSSLLGSSSWPPT